MNNETTPLMTEHDVLRLEARMCFMHPGELGSVVIIDVYRARDDQRIETAAYSGSNYDGRTYISLTTQLGCPVRCDFCKVSELALVCNVTTDEYVGQVERVVACAVPGFDAARPSEN